MVTTFEIPVSASAAANIMNRLMQCSAIDEPSVESFLITVYQCHQTHDYPANWMKKWRNQLNLSTEDEFEEVRKAIL